MNKSSLLAASILAMAAAGSSPYQTQGYNDPIPSFKGSKGSGKGMAKLGGQAKQKAKRKTAYESKRAQRKAKK